MENTAGLRRGRCTPVVFAVAQPSEQDKLLTRAIVLAAETIGLQVVDHLVVSSDKTFSFWQARLL